MPGTEARENLNEGDIYYSEEHHDKQREHLATRTFKLGPGTSWTLYNDPKRLAFVLSRYKFCSRIIEGRENVLEVGCGEGFGLPIVAKAVGRIVALDGEEVILRDTAKRLCFLENVKFSTINFLEDRPGEIFNAAYALDLIEHIPKEHEHGFMKNLHGSVHDDGIALLGTPNVTTAPYASEASRVAHVNLKSHEELRNLMGEYFVNTFMFSMNDEIVHTGFHPMAHYIFSLGVGKRL